MQSIKYFDFGNNNSFFLVETVMVSSGYFIYASTQLASESSDTHYDALDSTVNITTTVVDNTPINFRKKRGLPDYSVQPLRRTKRETFGGNLPEGCKYVFADGSRDARDNKELSIQQKFFDLQEYDTWVGGEKKFIIKLNITKSVWDGRKFSHSYGTAYMNIFINSAPENGTCTIKLPAIDQSGKKFIF